MSKDDLKTAENKEERSNPPSSTKGTGNLLLGSAVGAYGAAFFAATGAVCPTCVVLAPVLLGYGAYKRVKFHKKQK